MTLSQANHTAKKRTRNSQCDRQCVKNKTRPTPLFFCVFFFLFSGAGGKGEYRSFPGSLIYRHPVLMMTDKTGSNPDRVVASLKNRKRTNQGYATGILDHLWDTRSVPWRDPRLEYRPKTVLYQLENMSPRSNLYCIQTTVPPLIAQFLLDACIPRNLMIPGLISISVPGTHQLDQEYSVPTIVRPVKDDQVWSLCPRHDQNRD
jgi:hypothetical protein